MFARQNNFSEIFDELLNFNCVKGLKIETGEETSDFRQNLVLRELAGKNNLIFALSSTNSLNDLELAKALGADWIISPFIESEKYANRFLSRANEIVKAKYFIFTDKEMKNVKCDGYCIEKGEYTIIDDGTKKFLQTSKIIFNDEFIDAEIIDTALKFEIAWLNYRKESRCSLNIIEKKKLEYLRTKVIHATII